MTNKELADKIAAGTAVLYMDANPAIPVTWGVTESAFWFEFDKPHGLALSKAVNHGYALAWPGFWLVEAADSEGDVSPEDAREAREAMEATRATDPAFYAAVEAQTEAASRAGVI